LVAAAVLTFAVIAQAQQTGKVFRIGILDPTTAFGSAVVWEALRQELSKLGWIEGKNIAIEYRFSGGKTENLPELAADLVRLKVDVIVTSGVPPALEAKKATSTIPIVTVSVLDPVALGLVASLGRPGGNVTGLATLNSALTALGKDPETFPNAVDTMFMFIDQDGDRARQVAAPIIDRTIRGSFPCRNVS